MKTLIVCIVVTLVASSNGTFLSLFGGGGLGGGLGGGGGIGGLLNIRPAPEEHIHHHHHRHEVLHTSRSADHNPSTLVKVVHHPVVVQPEHVQIYKVLYDHGHNIQQGYGSGYGYAAPQVITKVVHPIVNKNFIHNTHQHYYQRANAGPVHHGWD